MQKFLSRFAALALALSMAFAGGGSFARAAESSALPEPATSSLLEEMPEDAISPASSGDESPAPSAQAETAEIPRLNTASEPVKQASGTPVTLFLASDYQYQNQGQPKNNLKAILKEEQSAGFRFDNAIFCGDYSNKGQKNDHQISPEPYIKEIKSVFKGAVPNVNQMIFVQGNHDKKTASISASGAHEFDDYIVYVVNTQSDFPWRQGRKHAYNVVKKAAEKLDNYLQKLIRSGERRPVLIAGHVPLHYSNRTANSAADNIYASLLFDVVNEAGKELDIFYMMGHNHTGVHDAYLGGSCIYRAAGSRLPVPSFSSSKDTTGNTYTVKTLHFTYFNAGYVGNYAGGGSNSKTGTVMQIYDDHVALYRYSANGRRPIGNAGYSTKGAKVKSKKYYASKTNSPISIPRKRQADDPYTRATPIPTSVNTAKGVTIQWNAVSGTAGYRVFYKGSNGWTKLGDTTATRLTWQSAKSGTEYVFTVRCLGKNGKGYSSYYYRTGTRVRRLAQPTVSKAVNTYQGIHVAWSQVKGAAGYTVWRRTTGGWEKIYTAKKNSTLSYTDREVKSKSAVTYTYTVRAYRDADLSSYSGGETLCRVPTPVLSQAVNAQGNRLKATWEKVSKVSGYQLQYAASQTCAGGEVLTLNGADTLSHTLSGLTKGKTYSIRVRAFRQSGGVQTCSGWSNVKQLKIA